MEPKTDEQLFWWKQGVVAMIAENKKQYECCSTPDPQHGIACETFDCLGAAVTADQLNRIKRDIWPDFVKGSECA
jgi:hypothetical protein